MNRKVLLIEPNYKNKYPPMGLMKIATYYRLQSEIRQEPKAGGREKPPLHYQF